MHLWWSLRTLYLHTCQVRVVVGNSGLCCACMTSFECQLTPLFVETGIGRFSEAGLLEWMRFVIFRARRRERSQRTSGPTRRCFTLCITVEVEPRVAKQYKCQYFCSCKNYRGKGMEGGKKKCLCVVFWLTRRSRVRRKNAFWGIL